MTRKPLVLAISLALSALGSSAARADTWNCATGFWDTGACWSDGTVPVAGDVAQVGPVGGFNTVLTYDTTAGNRQAAGLQIDSTSPQTVFFIHTGGTLNISGNQVVGVQGAAHYSAAGGASMVVGGDLVVGSAATANGSYVVSGWGTNLNAGSLTVGDSGKGSFQQYTYAGVASNELVIGRNAGAQGQYDLVGGSLATNNQTIGNQGTGRFNQGGGTNSIGTNLTLGAQAFSNGTYTLNAGALNVAGAIVDGAGTGRLNIDGGTLTVGGGNGTIGVDYLTLGSVAGSSGSHALGGNGAIESRNQFIGSYGSGAFVQSGGTNTIDVNFVLGQRAGSVGSYALDGGSLTARNSTIGSTGTGSLTQAGGNYASVEIDVAYASGSSGDLSVSGGTLSTARLSLGVSGEGNVSQTGGDVTIGLMNAGGTMTGIGRYELNAGTLSSGAITLGIGGTGMIVQNGGTHANAFNLTLGETVGGEGRYTLNGGTLTTRNVVVGSDGNGVMLQTGGSHTVAGTLTIAAFYGTGSYHLSGGSLRANEIVVNPGGSFSFTGGTLAVDTFRGDLANTDSILAPGNSPGTTTIIGNYTQGALGTYSVEIGGTGAGEFDVLDVSGTASLDGLLQLALYDLGSGLFVPHAGDHFDILTADVLSGSFSSLAFAGTLGAGLEWRLEYLTDFYGSTDVVRLSVIDGQLAPIPEPETYAMLLAGLGLIGFVARRRKYNSRFSQ